MMDATCPTPQGNSLPPRAPEPTASSAPEGISTDAPRAHDGAMTKVLASARRTIGALRWYWRGVTGADAYERYVAYLQRTCPDALVPSQKQFWRDKYEDMERNPKARCC